METFCLKIAPNHCVQATPGCAYYEFLSQVSGAPLMRIVRQQCEQSEPN